MKKGLLFISMIFLIILLTGCGGEEVELGEAVLTITGKIDSPNSGDAYIFDEAAFEKYSVELTMDDPWMGDGLNYKGILLSKILELVDPSSGATTISIIAVDGKSIDIAIEDAEKWDIMMVHYIDGELFGEDLGGPVKIAFSEEASGTYNKDNWMWWVVEVKIK